MVSVSQTGPFAGQHVVVIGGSSGVGFALAAQAHAAGARLTLLARDAGKLQLAAERLEGAANRTVDLGQAETIAGSLAGMGDVDHLVITAGTIAFATIAESMPEAWRQVLEERIIGPLAVIKTLAPRIKQSIVLFSGAVVHRPSAGGAMLAVAAAGVESLVRALALELAPLRVNAVEPGLLDTAMVDALLGDAKAGVLADIAATLPVRRAGTAEDAASAAVFLMQNSYVTGTVLAVNGGSLLI